MKDESIIEFPCDFQIKIIGDNHATFFEDIVAIARKHFPDLPEEKIVNKPSQQGNYLAVSITVYALDKASLDALYTELTNHPQSKMVL